MKRLCIKCNRLLTGHSKAILCKSCAHKGAKFSEETKKKMSAAAKNKILSDETRKRISDGVKKARPKQHYYCSCGQEITWRKKHCKSCAMKIRFSNPKEIEKFVRRKEKHYNWQNGKSFEKYGCYFTNKLKQEIRKRDNYKCYICKLNKKLDIHHIDYNKKNCDKNNLIGLCKSCHMKTNFNRDYWKKYLGGKNNE